ncbi:MAG: DNA alkylation repair protein, partial [Thermoplasmata archaeon]|nr:DNA alkylation repair protein [Thermoplasmata archaeon]
LIVIERTASDDRRYVKKAVNWSLRQIGKRSEPLRRSAIASALRIQHEGSRSGRWIASDALRELRSKAVVDRLMKSARTGLSRQTRPRSPRPR